MKRYRNLLFYIFSTGFFSLLIYFFIKAGKSFETDRDILTPSTGLSRWSEVVATFAENLGHPLTILLAQIVIIILVVRIFGWLFKKIHQPEVIGEILAGIFLGPSFLGYFFPGILNALFPADSLGNLYILSHIGLILFMFMVGMELDFSILKNKVNKAVIVSHTGILFSFALGMGLAYMLYDLFAPRDVSFLSFGLFIGISVSITAFPVLARIMQERGIHKTMLGKFVITCAAVDDITAWSLLAVVISVVKAGSFFSSLYTVVLSVLYVYLMLGVVRPFLARIGELYTSREFLTKPVVAVFFLVLVLSAWATEAIGIHAIFGGFLAGVIMPENVKFRSVFIEKVEDVAMVLFLPLFFVLTGLRTQIGLLNDPFLWKICFLIIVAAVTGKFLGGTLSAKFTGQGWKESLTIGTLMNTRGLVELVVLNIGFDLGVLSPEIFAMLVLMALFTTFMTAPIIELINWIFKRGPGIAPTEVSSISSFKVLLSFGNPERGRSLLRLANSLIKRMPGNASITAMHLSPGSDLFQAGDDEYEKESFFPIIEESQEINQEFTTLFKISSDIESDITEIANKGEFDLLLVGVGQSIFEGSLLGKVIGFTSRVINPAKLFYKIKGKDKPAYISTYDERTRMILSKSEVPTGIFIDKNLTRVQNVLVMLFVNNDLFLVQYARKLIDNSDSVVTVCDPSGFFNKDMLRDAKIVRDDIIRKAPGSDNAEQEVLFPGTFDLILLSTEGWSILVENHPRWLYGIPSTLILSS